MKQRMIITILAVLAVLSATGVKVFAREAQPLDDRGRSSFRFSSHFMIKNGMDQIDDHGGSAQSSGDLSGDDRDVSGKEAEDLDNDEDDSTIVITTTLTAPSSTPEPFDDKGLSGHGADDLPGDDKGGATPTSIAPASPTQPADDRGGSGHGSDNLPGDDRGGSSKIDSASRGI